MLSGCSRNVAFKGVYFGARVLDLETQSYHFSSCMTLGDVSIIQALVI